MQNIQFVPGAISAGECVSSAWETIKIRYWMYVGVAFLGVLISAYLYCISWFLLGPILAGVYYLTLRDMRGEPVDFGMMFKGFEKFVPLMVIGLIESIPTIIGQILGFALNIGTLLIPKKNSGDLDFFQSSNPDFAIAGGFFAVIIVVAVGFMIFNIIWYVLFFFAVPLAFEYDFSPVEAIKLSARAGIANAGGLIFLGILTGLIIILGVLLRGVGLIFISFPIMYVARAFAYRQVFPYIDRQFNLNPPPPTAYSFGGPHY